MIGETIARRSESNNGLLVSTVIHGALALGAVLLIGHKIVEAPAPKVELVDITPAMIAPASSQPSTQPSKTKGSRSPGAIGQRGRAARDADSHARMTTSVETGSELGTGTGEHGLGTGAGLYGNGLDGMPGGVGTEARKLGVPSLKRDPEPREDYSSSQGFRPPPEQAGKTVIVDLELDAEGNVTATTVTKGTGADKVDDAVVEAIRRFKFFPALDDAGKAIPSKYHWLWVLQPPTCPEDYSTATLPSDRGGKPVDKRCVRAR